MDPHYDLARLHQADLEREAEHQRLGAHVRRSAVAAENSIGVRAARRDLTSLLSMWHVAVCRLQSFLDLTGHRFFVSMAVASLLCTGLAPVSSDVASAQVSDNRARAEFTWSVRERYDQSWEAWHIRSVRDHRDDAAVRSFTTHEYDPNFVSPDAWPININACASSGGQGPITQYQATIVGVGFEFQRAIESATCQLQAKDLPRLGSYTVTLVVSNTLSRSLPFTRTVLLADTLIVSLGDSLASGEGNPDEPGLYDVDAGATSVDVNKTIRAAEWKDRQCHRSARSGHALAARQIERRDPHSSVTFLSLACSGAELRHLFRDEYDGLEAASNDSPAKPQLQVLEELVGRRAPAAKQRKIDVLLISAGVNDLDFGDIIDDCATNVNAVDAGDPDCVYDRAILANLASLPGKYDQLSARLDSGLDVGEVYLADYPADPFHGGGCGYLGISGIGINNGEAEAMAQIGERLNTSLRRISWDHHWNFVEGMTAAFRDRAYCDSPSFFVGYQESYETQGNEKGTAHPNHDGHAAYRDLLLESIVVKPPPPYRRVTVSFDQILVGRPADNAEPQNMEIEFEDRTSGEHARTAVLPDGKWDDIVGRHPSFTFDVYPSPAPPRYATAVDFNVRGPRGVLELRHTLAQAYGAGDREMLHLSGPQVDFGVRYHVDVEQLPSSCGRSDDPAVDPPTPPLRPSVTSRPGDCISPYP